MVDSDRSESVRVVVVDPEGRRKVAGLSENSAEPVRVGRAPENDIQLISPYISRRHAELRFHEGGVVFADLASTSGSYVDGTRVDMTILKVGESAFLGSPDGLRLTIHSHDEEIDLDQNDRQQTEVLRVTDLENSAYLTSTGRLFARPGLHPDKMYSSCSSEVDAEARGGDVSIP